MNQSQRNFLIKKIEKSAKDQIDALRSSIPNSPSLNNYLLHAVMSGNFDIKSKDEIKEVIRQKALKAKEREDWLGNSWHSTSKKSVVFEAEEIFIIPEEYKSLASEYIKSRNEIEANIRTISLQLDSLITRIQLASDKTLQTMINEVDDMGNISLFDEKLKLLAK